MGEKPDIKRKAVALVGEIREDELAVRMIEALGLVRRPPGKTAAEVLALTPVQVADGARRQARVAVAYFAECLAKAGAPQ
jgi:hypothetical protein